MTCVKVYGDYALQPRCAFFVAREIRPFFRFERAIIYSFLARFCDCRAVVAKPTGLNNVRPVGARRRSDRGVAKREDIIVGPDQAFWIGDPNTDSVSGVCKDLASAALGIRSVPGCRWLPRGSSVFPLVIGELLDMRTVVAHHE